jgi:uncharacterized protein YabE (DUF348 family)
MAGYLTLLILTVIMLKTLAQGGIGMLQNLKNTLANKKNYFSRGPIVALIALLTVIIVVSTVYVVSFRKVLTVCVNGKKTIIVSYKSTVKEILAQNKIKLGPKDKIEPSVDTKVKNGQEIDIEEAVGLEIVVDGKDLKIKSAEKSVKELLKSEGVSLSSLDKVEPSRNAAVQNGMKIVVTRVVSKTFTEEQPIAFSTIVQNDDSMPNDQNQVIQQGSAGTEELTINATYEDGKEVVRNIMSEVVKSAPVNAIIKQGTLGVIMANRGGRVVYKKKVSALATGYTDDLGFGITACGTRTKRDVNGYSSISVDPRVIPLGTKLYIPGYGYGLAEDTGGLIKGNRIDLFFNSTSDCDNWGAKNVDVYILN